MDEKRDRNWSKKRLTTLAPDAIFQTVLEGIPSSKGGKRVTTGEPVPKPRTV